MPHRTTRCPACGSPAGGNVCDQCGASLGLDPTALGRWMIGVAAVLRATGVALMTGRARAHRSTGEGFRDEARAAPGAKR